MNEMLTALISIFTLVLGSLLTWLITRQTKKQEWRTEVNKQLIQRRLDAYEQIIEATKGIAVGGDSYVNGEYTKFHLIVTESEYFNVWSLKFMAVYSRFSHLIDSELSYELFNLNNYLKHLNNHLENWKAQTNTEISEEKLKIFGQIIYKDIQTLTSDIMEASGKFYSKSIYKDSYEPSTINREEYQLPTDFKSLFLFSEKRLLDKLIES